MTVDLSPAGRVAQPRSDAGASRLRPRRETVLVIAVMAVAAALRFATLTHQSLWFDEAQAVHEMRLSLSSMLHAWSVSEPNPPLYFVVAWLWTKVFGADAAGLRSLSAVAGTVTVPIVCLCGRELVSRRAGMFAAAFAALSPFMIWYSQEAREYMLATALAAASLVFFARLWRGRGSRRDLVRWTVFSALALLTEYFAIFLVGAAALILLYRNRDRATAIAMGALVLVEATLIEHLTAHTSRSAQWVGAIPLSMRVRQVPVAFGFSPQYQSPSALSYGLLAAALLLALMIGLLVVAADAGQLRGAGIAAGLAAAVLLIPLVAALVGPDYYVARAMIPGWVPLAVVVGAACASVGAERAGAALAIVLCGLFVYAGVKIDGDSTYQRSNWRGVADALGPAHSTRAIVAFDDGTFGTAPLAVYLPGVAWTGPHQIPQVSDSPVMVHELDVIGSTTQTIPRRLPSGLRLIGSQRIDTFELHRFALTDHARQSSPDALDTLAGTLLGYPDPVASVGAVLIQHESH